MDVVFHVVFCLFKVAIAPAKGETRTDVFVLLWRHQMQQYVLVAPCVSPYLYTINSLHVRSSKCNSTIKLSESETISN